MIKRTTLFKNSVLLMAFCFGIQTIQAQEPTACGTMLESIEGAPIDELGKEYRRLKSYSNPYCDTTNSDLHKLMEELANQLNTSNATADAIVAQYGEPYYRGPLSDYENQKVTVGRGGKMLGKALPPQFKIPAGDYYVVYFWRNKDYLTFALKGSQSSEYSWWEKGNYR